MKKCLCGCSLKTGCRIIAVVEMVVSGFLFLASLVVSSVLIREKLGVMSTSTTDQKHGGSFVAIIAAVIIFVIAVTAKFYYSLSLKQGVEQENLNKCYSWVSANASVIGAIIFAILQQGTIATEWYTTAVYTVILFYQCFCAWIVHEFMFSLR